MVGGGVTGGGVTIAEVLLPLTLRVNIAEVILIPFPSGICTSHLIEKIEVRIQQM